MESRMTAVPTKVLARATRTLLNYTHPAWNGLYPTVYLLDYRTDGGNPKRLRMSGLGF